MSDLDDLRNAGRKIAARKRLDKAFAPGQLMDFINEKLFMTNNIAYLDDADEMMDWIAERLAESEP